MADNILQDFNSTLLAITTDQARSASTSANSARAKALDAAKSADHAETVSGSASRLASDALGRVGQTRTQLDAANKDLAALQSRIAWRAVSEDQKKLLKLGLLAFPRKTIDLEWENSDPELNWFAPQIAVGLGFAGVHVNPRSAAMISLRPQESETLEFFVEGVDKPFVDALADTLKYAGLAKNRVARWYVPTLSGNPTIRIRPRDTR